MKKEDVRNFAMDIAAELKVNGYEAEVIEVTKVNGTYIGISVRVEPANPVIYMEPYYEAYAKGQLAFPEVVGKVWASIENSKNILPVNGLTAEAISDIISDYDEVRPRLIAQLINYEANTEYLEDKAFLRYRDLAIVFRIILGTDDNGTIATIVVTTSMLFGWYGVTARKLQKDAISNMEKDKLFMSMNTILAAMGHPLDPTQDSPEMFVLSNNAQYFGAAVILSEKVRKEVTERLGDNVMVIPSSVHELILVSQDVQDDEDVASYITGLIQQVNDSPWLDPQEVLSDHPYYLRNMTFVA